MNILVTGGAGFIGGHLIDALLEQKNTVICVDNLVLGTEKNIEHNKGNKDFFFYNMDISEEKQLTEIMRKHQIEMVYHLAANSDIQKGGKEPSIDFRDTFMTTRSVLEAMRTAGAKKLFFASTSAVYGNKINTRLVEDMGGLAPISYYGGAKLASEAFISSYAYMNDFQVVVFRFPNVIGPRLTHGVLFDFKRKLLQDSKQLEILGDGTQCKQYIYVKDLVAGILMMTKNISAGVGIYNIGVETATTVKEIADIMCDCMKLQNVIYNYTGGNCGWKGDVPKFEFDIAKITKCGWKANCTSNEAVRKTIESIMDKE